MPIELPQTTDLGLRKRVARVCIGLGLPFVGLVVALPLVLRLPPLLFGVPSFLVWIWVWMVVSSLCLATCWLLFDRPDLNSAAHPNALPSTASAATHSEQELP